MLVLISLLGACQRVPNQENAIVGAPPMPMLDPGHEPEIRAFENADKAAPPASGIALFIGSPSIRMWDTLGEHMAPAPVLTRGFGGSRTPEILSVFDRIVLPYDPGGHRPAPWTSPQALRISFALNQLALFFSRTLRSFDAEFR